MADQWGTTLHKLDLYVIKWNCGEIMYIYQGCQFCFDRCFVFSIGMECFSFEVFRGCTVHIYIYIYINIIQIQDKLIINYAIQTQCQTNIILNFKIFLNSQD